jgi:hypothetical protein
MKPKIETVNNETIVCLGENNCAKWAKGKERQVLSMLNADCDEAREILTQLGYDKKSIAELTSDACGCPQVDPRFCSDPETMKFIAAWRPAYIPYRKYNTLPAEARELINELMRRGYVKVLTCCVEYDEECRCVKAERGFFITARAVDYDNCIKYSRNKCAMTVRQAIAGILSYLSQSSDPGNR